mgnify:CR=1 FL=1
MKNFPFFKILDVVINILYILPNHVSYFFRRAKSEISEFDTPFSDVSVIIGRIGKPIGKANWTQIGINKRLLVRGGTIANPKGISMFANLRHFVEKYVRVLQKYFFEKNLDRYKFGLKFGSFKSFIIFR